MSRVVIGFLMAPILFGIAMQLDTAVSNDWHRGQWHLRLDNVAANCLFMTTVTYVYLLLPALIIVALMDLLFRHGWRFILVRKIGAMLAAAVYAVIQVVAIIQLGDGLSNHLNDDAARSMLDRILWPARSSDHRISILAAMIALALAWWVVRARAQEQASPT
jgi:hypothetical protein